jgi:hypothetical protein
VLATQELSTEAAVIVNAAALNTVQDSYMQSKYNDSIALARQKQAELEKMASEAVTQVEDTPSTTEALRLSAQQQQEEFQQQVQQQQALAQQHAAFRLQAEANQKVMDRVFARKTTELQQVFEDDAVAASGRIHAQEVELSKLIQSFGAEAPCQVEELKKLVYKNLQANLPKMKVCIQQELDAHHLANLTEAFRLQQTHQHQQQEQQQQFERIPRVLKHRKTYEPLLETASLHEDTVKVTLAGKGSRSFSQLNRHAFPVHMLTAKIKGNGQVSMLQRNIIAPVVPPVSSSFLPRVSTKHATTTTTTDTGELKKQLKRTSFHRLSASTIPPLSTSELSAQLMVTQQQELTQQRHVRITKQTKADEEYRNIMDFEFQQAVGKQKKKNNKQKQKRSKQGWYTNPLSLDLDQARSRPASGTWWHQHLSQPTTTTM